jgi:hypothetical protein
LGGGGHGVHGCTLLIDASSSFLDGEVLRGRIAILLAAVFFALAYAVYRGSRPAAVAVVALFVLSRATVFLAYGWMAMSPLWTLILGAMLWAGMRGVFAKARRPAAPRRTL